MGLFSRNNERKLPKGTYLNSVEILNADNNPDLMIKIVPVGYFPEHPNGAHEVTKEHIREMAGNLKNAGTDILFDIGHESIWWAGCPAAGWSPKENAEARDDGLYIRYPEFTPKTKEKVNDREFRYFSPVYHLNGKDKSGRELGAELVSVALTNIPYLDKEIDSIKNSNVEETKMDPKELRQKLGLAEDATDEVVNSKIDELAKLNSQPPPELPAVIPPVISEEPSEAEKLNSRLKALEDAQVAQRAADQTARVETLVNAAIGDGKIKPAEKDVYLNSAKLDYDGTKAKLDALKKNSAMPNNLNAPAPDQPGKPQTLSEIMNSGAAYLKAFNRQPQPKESK